MDFQESEAFLKENESKQQKKKMLLIGIVTCILFVAFMATIIVYLQIQDAKTFKMFINGKKVPTSKTFVYTEENKKTGETDYYVDLRELSKALGYMFQDGSVALTEGENLYTLTTHYEQLDINADKMTFDKYVTVEGTDKEKRVKQETTIYGQELTIRTPKDTREIFHLQKPLIAKNGTVYASREDINMLLSINYSWSNDNIYRLRISTLDSLYARYAPIAANAGYTSFSGDFENIRAILDGFLVVEKNGKYGVIDKTGQVIIEAKYERLQFSQNSKEFFAYANSKAGLIDKNGQQLIPPTTYQDIAILDQNLDQDNRLYLVSKDGKYGVIDRKGTELIHPLYDKIGLDSTVELYKTLEDPIILFNKVIPIKQENTWGLYNLETGELSGYDESTDQFNYAGFGCDISSSKTSANQKSIVLIPKEVGIKGVVIMYKSGLYGIYDCNVNSISVTFMWSRIYSNTDNKTGVVSYYMENNVTGEKVELNQFLTENSLITETGEDEEDDDTADTSSGGSSFTEEMNNLSTDGKLNNSSNEDEQYFDNLENQNTDEENTSEEGEGNEESDESGDESTSEQNDESEEDEVDVY